MHKTVYIKKKVRQTVVKNAAEKRKYILEDGAELRFIIAAARGWEGKRLLEFELRGKGSSLDLMVLIAGSGEDVFEFGTAVIHGGAGTRSRQEIRSILKGRSKVSFAGNVVVEADARRADAFMAHRNLLLSGGASVRTLPALEIKAKECNAGHAATAGKIDEEMLFYLQSRGIARSTAEKMLAEAFLGIGIRRVEDATAQRKAWNFLGIQSNNISHHAV